jgi:hypothetical protein
MMTDYHTEFSVGLGALTEKELSWLKDFLQPCPEDKQDKKYLEWWTKAKKRVIKDTGFDDPECWPDVDFIVEKDQIILFSEESKNPDFTSHVIHEFLKEFRPDGYVTFEWAYTCSRLRLDGFGGGAAFITAKKVTIMGTSGWLWEKEKQFNNRRKKRA